LRLKKGTKIRKFRLEKYTNSPIKAGILNPKPVDTIFQGVVIIWSVKYIPRPCKIDPVDILNPVNQKVS